MDEQVQRTTTIYEKGREPRVEFGKKSNPFENYPGANLKSKYFQATLKNYGEIKPPSKGSIGRDSASKQRFREAYNVFDGKDLNEFIRSSPYTERLRRAAEENVKKWMPHPARGWKEDAILKKSKDSMSANK